MGAFYNKDKLPCRACGKGFDGGETVTFHQRRWHDSCFKCRKCSLDLVANPSEHPLELHEYPYCHPCYCDETGKSLCYGCHKLVDENEKFVHTAKFPNRKYHTGCFLCADCHSPLKDAYSTKEGKPHCLSCWNPTENLGITA